MHCAKKTGNMGKTGRAGRYRQGGLLENLSERHTFHIKVFCQPLPSVDQRVEFSLYSSLTLPPLIFHARAFKPNDLFWKCYHLLA